MLLSLIVIIGYFESRKTEFLVQYELNLDWQRSPVKVYNQREHVSPRMNFDFQAINGYSLSLFQYKL